MQELCHCAIAQQSFGTGLRASQGAKSWRNLRPRGGRGGRLGGCADSTGNSARRHALSRRGDTGDRRENGATAPAEVTFSGRKSVGLPYPDICPQSQWEKQWDFEWEKAVDTL